MLYTGQPASQEVGEWCRIGITAQGIDLPPPASPSVPAALAAAREQQYVAAVRLLYANGSSLQVGPCTPHPRLLPLAKPTNPARGAATRTGTGTSTPHVAWDVRYGMHCALPGPLRFRVPAGASGDGARLARTVHVAQEWR